MQNNMFWTFKETLVWSVGMFLNDIWEPLLLNGHMWVKFFWAIYLSLVNYLLTPWIVNSCLVVKAVAIDVWERFWVWANWGSILYKLLSLGEEICRSQYILGLIHSLNWLHDTLTGSGIKIHAEVFLQCLIVPLIWMLYVVYKQIVKEYEEPMEFLALLSSL